MSSVFAVHEIEMFEEFEALMQVLRGRPLRPPLAGIAGDAAAGAIGDAALPLNPVHEDGYAVVDAALAAGGPEAHSPPT